MNADFLRDYEFFTGVPDSLLQPFCNWLMDRYNVGEKHVIAANEGNAVGLAAGYHLSTGKVPVVYLQNSGQGNIINPVVSLMNEKVYAIPCIFVIGWRGEPDVHDEPQHIFQGEITINLMEDIGIETFVIDKETTEEQVENQLEKWQCVLKAGKQVAFIIKKGALEYGPTISYSNDNLMNREEILKYIVGVSGQDIIVSTTGKASRELFEIRENNNQGHKCDFLTVGSMGHSSSIAFQIAKIKKDKKIWCVDGDGALLMHMGAMALIGANQPQNFVHIVINNGSHETVGGLPTVFEKLDIKKIAEGCGYKNIFSAETYEQLETALKTAKNKNELSFIEVKCSIGSRKDLGRPTTTPKENKKQFMEFLN